MGKILEMKQISKSFPGVKALSNVDLELETGDILALLGENGAGKSTLIKVLSGVHKADEGKIVYDGKETEFATPGESIAAGISVIYQELNNVDELTIAENIFLGNLPLKKPLNNVDYRKLREDTQRLLDEVGLRHDPFTEVSKLSIAEKQMVEIAKALSKDLKVLVMDEPTATLNNTEIETLFGIIRQIAAQGKGVIYISHRLEEVFEISNKVEVMRDGKKVAVAMTQDTNRQELITHMVGRELGDMYPKKTAQKGETVIEIKNLSNEGISGINFSVAAGEVVGLYGLMGAGRTNIAETIFGARKKTDGEIVIHGKTAQIRSPKDAKEYGIAYIPPDRKRDGLILEHSIKTNISLTMIDRLQKGLKLQFAKEAGLAGQWVDRLAIKTPDMENLADSLSGGNQQKIVLAKWLATDPKILILNEPTRGVDVGAKAEIYKLIEELQHSGIATIMISSELPEVIAMSDRIIVIHEGKVSGEVAKEDFSQETLLSKAIGGELS